MSDTKKYKFSDEIHADTNDGFRIETDYKGRKFVHIYQEMYSNVIRKLYLSESDIRQIYAKLEENE